MKSEKKKNVLESTADAYDMGDWSVSEELGLFKTEKQTVVSRTPVLPVEILKSPEQGPEKVKLMFLDCGRVRTVIKERETIANRAKIICLANDGIDVTSKSAGELVNALNDILSRNRRNMPVHECVPHLGWHGREFIPYSDRVLFAADDDYGSISCCIAQEGTSEEWNRYMVPLMKESPKLRLAIAASLASPLIEIIGQNPFIFHLWGKSGSGKTVTAMCSASIWGNPNSGRYMKSLNMTVNALLTNASVLKNLPFIGDELQTIRSRGEGYDRLIMTACEGINRGRMNRSRLEETLSWRNSFIFTGEEPVTGTSSGAGAVNRVIQVEASENLIPNGNETVNFICSHYGAVGKEFIERLDRDLAKDVYADITAMLRKWVAERKRGCTEKQLGAMALILTADLIYRDVFTGKALKDFAPDEILPYLTDPSEVDTSERAYDYICNVISANSMAFTHDAKESWGVIKGSHVFINNSILERELRRGDFESRSVKKGWADSGHIKYNSKEGRYTFFKNIWGSKARCVCLIIPTNEDED